MQSQASTLVILGTGGTIAGTSGSRHDNVGYQAAQLDVAQLLQGVAAPGAMRLEAEQLAQVDSKDMDHTLWQRLGQRVAQHLARDTVAGIVITHGTDTLEETAYFLHRVLAPCKPVVLTAAMRPASSLLADGPQNLRDALSLACWSGARGVLAVMANTVFAAPGLRKAHSYRIDALSGGDAGPLGRIEEGRLRRFQAWPEQAAIGQQALQRPAHEWPRVEIVYSHAGAGPLLVEALMAQAPRGLIVAGTGNGSVHAAMQAALLRAISAGVAVRRCTRCANGVVIAGAADALPGAGDLTPVQARIELMLELMRDTQ